MPSLSEAMKEGTLLRWLQDDGAEIQAGEPIAEIETDKATMELEAETAGILSHRLEIGRTVDVGNVIAIIGPVHEPGGPVDSTQSAAPPPGDPLPPPPARSPGASPVARRMAQEHGIEIESVQGSGRGGRIVRADVEAAIAASTGEPAALKASDTRASGAETAKGSTEIVEPTRLQEIVARRMSEAKSTVPDFALRVEVDMGECLALRAGMKEVLPGPVPSINDMIVKASALALREHPQANASFRDGRFELHSRVNIGFAVAGEGRLVVPTVFDADTKSLGAIAGDTRVLAERARDGAITAPELSGGTFTVSNLGMFGVESFTAVINPPQAAILAVGAIEQRPVVRGGAIVVGQLAALTLTCDHRILYGADAAQFLDRIRRLLENPAAAFVA